MSTGSPSTGGDGRREKSLGLLSQKFLQLLTHHQIGDGKNAPAALSLEEASEKLGGMEKKKVRRLYDIANILIGIGIITKTHDSRRRPAFRWVGWDNQNLNPNVNAGTGVNARVAVHQPHTALHQHSTHPHPAHPPPPVPPQMLSPHHHLLQQSSFILQYNNQVIHQMIHQMLASPTASTT